MIYYYGDETAEQHKLYEQLFNVDILGADIEATSENPAEAVPLGIAFAPSDRYAFYLTWDEPDVRRLLQLNCLYVFFNGKYDMRLIQKFLGIKGLRNEDPMLAYHAIGMDGSLPQIGGSTWVVPWIPSIDSLLTPIKGVRKRRIPAQVGPEELAPMCCIHARVTLALLKNMPRVHAYRRIDLPLIPILIDMEEAGCHVSQDNLQPLLVEYTEKKQSAKSKFYSLINRIINLDSSEQVAKVLEDYDFAKSLPRTKVKKQLSTDDEFLAPFRNHPVVSSLLDYRQAAKQLSTYVEAFLGKGQVSTTYGLTNTGRLSSHDINMQNLTVGAFRRVIVAPDGHSLVAADYSQLELRILAMQANDATMLDTFKRGGDIHAATAIEVFGTADKRREAKTLNFAIVYGATDKTVGERVGVSKAEAAGILKRYFDQFPGVRNYVLTIHAQATRDGFVESLFQRKRYLVGAFSAGTMNNWMYEDAMKQSVNTLVQGTAADMVKTAMVNIQQVMPSWAKMVLQVHDELLFEVEKGKEQEMAKLCHDVLEFDGMLPVEVKVGENWGELHASL